VAAAVTNLAAKHAPARSRRKWVYWISRESFQSGVSSQQNRLKKMGIGRRKFLQIFGSALAALSANVSPAVAVVDEVYINRKLGFAFRKPHGWHFGDVREMGKMKEGQLLDLEDEELARQIVEEADLPIVAVAQTPILATATSFDPGVLFFVDRLDEVDVPRIDEDFLTRLNDVEVDYNAAILKHFEVLQQPVLKSVSGCPACEYFSAFTFEHSNFESASRVRMRSLVIFQDRMCYTIRMYDGYEGDASKTYDYDQFIGDIRVM
jgi:hypothetical protein